MESMKSLCNCIPFTLPNKYGKAGMCTLTDIPCLNKYKGEYKTPVPVFEGAKHSGGNFKPLAPCQPPNDQKPSCVEGVLNTVVALFSRVGFGRFRDWQGARGFGTVAIVFSILENRKSCRSGWWTLCKQRFTPLGEKWSRYYPQHLEMEDLQQEMQDSISCPHCLPPCNTVQYKVYTSFGRMNRLQRSKNITRMTIFFSKAFANLYKIDITNTWFEVLLEGRSVFFIGFSLISAIEIIVLLCKLILHLVSK
ncbi:hypothetical protein NQ317_011607 [Molorchus minor]|uniref:Uncharacterized protein n=1 Tax=Molorchus minor TaxID=1323400 RepID=A0ABQ9J7L6_9CUCU|nr:hypothetical protein NQ317_011607 [Molorchus minor]